MLEVFFVTVPGYARLQQVFLGLLESDARYEGEQQPAEHGRRVPAELWVVRQRVVGLSVA